MTYEFNSNNKEVHLDRAKIIDINVGDTVQVNGAYAAQYEWTNQDQQLMETNPDADLVLKIKEDNPSNTGSAELVIKQKR